METEKLKQFAAERAVEEVESGMIVGLGTGSTIYYALLKLGEKVRGGAQYHRHSDLQTDRRNCGTAGHIALNTWGTSRDRFDHRWSR